MWIACNLEVWRRSGASANRHTERTGCYISVTHQRAGTFDDPVPVECRSGILLVGLHVVVTEDALVIGKHFVRQLLRNELATRIARVVTPDFRQDRAERRRELDQRVVLLSRKVVHVKLLTLHLAASDFAADRANREAGVG